MEEDEKRGKSSVGEPSISVKSWTIRLNDIRHASTIFYRKMLMYFKIIPLYSLVEPRCKLRFFFFFFCKNSKFLVLRWRGGSVVWTVILIKLPILRWYNVIEVVISGSNGSRTATKEPPLYVSSDAIALSGLLSGPLNEVSRSSWVHIVFGNDRGHHQGPFTTDYVPNDLAWLNVTHACR